jgi:homeobox domain-containing protein
MLISRPQITLSQICRSPLQNNFPFPEINEEVRRKFDQWWASQLTPQANPIAHKILPFINTQSAELDFAAPNIHNLQQSRESLIENHHPTHPGMMVHPALQTVHTQYPNQKTRMRTSFDPEMELPKLQRWFQENPHPSRQQIQTYVVQLNSLESRRGRKPLDVNNVVYWFKNARAAQKRAETRGSVHSLSNGYNTPSSLMMAHHGDYMKSSPSAPSDDVDNISQHSEDEDDDRPLSPQLPLQLTVHERHRSSSSPPHIECETRIKLEDEKILSPVHFESKSGDEEKNNSRHENSGSAKDGKSNDDSENAQNFSKSSSNNNNDDSIKSNNSIDHSSNSPQPRSPSPSEDLDIDDPEMSQMDEYRSPSPMDSKRDLLLPMMNPNSMFSAHSIMYMSHYIPAMQNAHQSMHGQSPALNSSGLNLSNSFNSSDERRKRNRTFIDPVTEVPKLEQWFSMNTHPSHNLILKYTEDLNRMPYR